MIWNRAPAEVPKNEPLKNFLCLRNHFCLFCGIDCRIHLSINETAFNDYMHRYLIINQSWFKTIKFYPISCSMGILSEMDGGRMRFLFVAPSTAVKLWTSLQVTRSMLQTVQFLSLIYDDALPSFKTNKVGHLAVFRKQILAQPTMGLLRKDLH